MFDIEQHLDLLPDNVKIINISYKLIKYLPDLSRFKNLKYLYCDTNELTSLPVLPEKLKILICYNNNLTSLPDLPENLERLECCYNQLTSLPILNKNLKILDCKHNLLTSLPVLPKNLKRLYCHYNKLSLLPVLPENLIELCCYSNDIKSLPVLSEKLKVLIYFGNPIYNIIHNNDLNIMNKQIKIWNNFRYLYYCLKYRKRFLRMMEPVIKKRYHPSYLYNLKEEDDLDEKLNEW